MRCLRVYTRKRDEQGKLPQVFSEKYLEKYFHVPLGDVMDSKIKKGNLEDVIIHLILTRKGC